MFVVEPKRDCPHFAQETNLLPPEHWTISADTNINSVNTEQDPVSIDIPTSQCNTCQDTSENWICLSCKAISCSRYVSGHSREHFNATEHALCLSFSDLTIWCNACDSYVVSPLGRPAHRALYFNKFGELSPSELLEQATINTGEVAEEKKQTNTAPSIETLRQALENVPHASFSASEEELTCCICQMDVEVGQNVSSLTTCSHRFHRACLLTWLLRTNECPTCRTQVLEAWARNPVVATK